MSDLTDALKIPVWQPKPVDRWEGEEWLRLRKAERDAARRVANPDIEAATAITYELRYIKDDDEWDDKIENITKRAVDAGFGITKNTDA